MKKLRTFRLTDETYTILQVLADEQRITKTEMLENLIDKEQRVVLPTAQNSWTVWDTMFAMLDYKYNQPFKDENIVMLGMRSYGFYNRAVDTKRALEIVELFLNKSTVYGKDIEYCYIDGDDGDFSFYSILSGDELLYKDLLDGYISIDTAPDYTITVVYTNETTPYFSNEHESVKWYYNILEGIDSKAYIQNKERMKHISKLESLAKLVYTPLTSESNLFQSVFAQINIDNFVGTKTKTIDELTIIYRQRAKELHPDINKSEFAELEFKALRGCYEYLKAKMNNEAMTTKTNQIRATA
jgi:hypothetical protein